MSWETYTCPSGLCDNAHWIVTQAEEAGELWQIGTGPSDSGFLVAAPEPIRPCYGERLLPALELKGVSPDVRYAA